MHEKRTYGIGSEMGCYAERLYESPCRKQTSQYALVSYLLQDQGIQQLEHVMLDM